MFDEYYQYKFITKQNPNPGDHFISKTIYSFQAEKYRYIAEVEIYDHNMYVIKFYPKHLQESKVKFSMVLNEEYAPKIIRTCINIMLEINAKDPVANFGFLGSNTILDDFKESRYMTQRYRIYRQLMLNFFSEKSYIHIENQTNSAYLLLSKSTSNPKDLLIQIQKMFIQFYPELDSE
jgi:hypothetical protein